jgi:hypothetical protein
MKQEQAPNPLIEMITHAIQPMPNKPAPNGIVRVVVKTHYGTKFFYADNPVADLFLKVQGGKTLKPESLKTLKANGYEIQYRYEEVKL